MGLFECAKKEQLRWKLRRSQSKEQIYFACYVAPKSTIHEIEIHLCCPHIIIILSLIWKIIFLFLLKVIYSIAGFIQWPSWREHWFILWTSVFLWLSTSNLTALVRNRNIKPDILLICQEIILICSSCSFKT